MSNYVYPCQLGRAIMTHIANPFAAADAPTLFDVFRATEADKDITTARRRNVLSSLRRFAQVAGMELSFMPATPGYYRKKLADLHPAMAGITAKRLANIKADVLWAIKRSGVRGSGKYLAPFLDAWVCLIDRIEDRRLLWTLSRFLHYCSAQGIEPEDVDDGVSTAYLRATTDETFIKNPRDQHRRTCRAWNKAVDEVPDWPRITLSIPRYRSTYMLPWSMFPESLRTEVDDWRAVLSGGDLLSDNHLVRPLRESSIETRRFQLRQFASALVHVGHDPTELTSLAVLVDLAAVRAGLRFFLDRSGGNPTSQICQFAILLTIIAQHWVKVDAAHLEALKRLRRKVTPRSEGMTQKNRDRLRQFDDQQTLLALLDFPRRQVEEARKRDPAHRATAIRIQIALAVEILINAPIRAGNLAALSLTRHLRFSRAGRQGTIHLVIPPEEVKNREPLEFVLPEETVTLLKLYLADYRSHLVDGENEWLFPGRNGQHKCRQALSGQIKKHIKQATGIDMNAHLFRHLAAKLYLDANPGGYEVVRRILAHRSMDTTTRCYAGLETLSAARHFDETILGVRDSLRRGDLP